MAPFNFLLFNIPVLSLIFVIELFGQNKNTIENLSFTILGIFYISLPLALLNFLYVPGIIIKANAKLIVLSFFILIWVNDTFAYLVGTIIGKHHIFKNISPKKSLEGYLGGLIFSLLAAFVLSYFFETLSIFQWIIFALIIVVFGSIGDF